MDKKVNVQPIYSFSKQMLSLASGHDLFCSQCLEITHSHYKLLDTKHVLLFKSLIPI